MTRDMTSNPIPGKPRRNDLACLLLGIACALCSAPHRASAQTPAKERWLVVPAAVSQGSGDDADMGKLTAPFEAALRNAGKDVLESPSAAVTFESKVSSEPVQLDDDEMSRLLRRVGEAARHLALGELVQAQQAMQGVNALSGPARDFLNREAVRARKIFDNCLVAAYLLQRGNEHDRALRQMLDCSRSFPGFRPEGRAYPPEIRELFDKATKRLGQLQSTTLLVRSGERMGCGVRLNGIEVGRSPMSFSDVRSGNTRVQLECDQGVPGRIHEIELQPGENHLLIDPDFDRIVRTRGALWFDYATQNERQVRAEIDAKTLAAALHVDYVVELWVSRDADSWQVSVRSLRGRRMTEVARLGFSLAQGYEPAMLAGAVASVVNRAEPKLVAAAGNPPAQSENASDTPAPDAGDEPVASRSDTLPWLGVPLAVVGGAGLVTGWVLYAERQDARRGLFEVGISTDSIDTYYNGGTASLIATSAGASVLTLSDYFLMPTASASQGVPVWAWGVGAAGLGVSLVGAGFALFGTHCDIGDRPVACQRFTADSHFGATLALNGLPLIGVPLTYVLRRVVRSQDTELRANVRADADTTSFNVQGRF